MLPAAGKYRNNPGSASIRGAGRLAWPTGLQPHAMRVNIRVQMRAVRTGSAFRE